MGDTEAIYRVEAEEGRRDRDVHCSQPCFALDHTFQQVTTLPYPQVLAMSNFAALVPF